MRINYLIVHSSSYLMVNLYFYTDGASLEVGKIQRRLNDSEGHSWLSVTIAKQWYYKSSDHLAQANNADQII